MACLETLVVTEPMRDVKWASRHGKIDHETFRILERYSKSFGLVCACRNEHLRCMKATVLMVLVWLDMKEPFRSHTDRLGLTYTEN